MTRKERAPTLQPRTGRSGYQLTVPLTEQEYWAVVHRARRLGVARSEYVRRAMFGEYGDPTFEQESVQLFYWPPTTQEGTPDDQPER